MDYGNLDDLRAAIAAAIPDNTTHQVSPADVRQSLIDIVDTFEGLLATPELIDAVNVADAGWTDTNGQYDRNDSAATGSITPAVGSGVYQKATTTLVFVKDLISGNWFLYDGDADFGYYVGDSSTNPWDVASWTSLDPGYDPAPTVTQATA